MSFQGLEMTEAWLDELPPRRPLENVVFVEPTLQPRRLSPKEAERRMLDNQPVAIVHPAWLNDLERLQPAAA